MTKQLSTVCWFYWTWTINGMGLTQVELIQLCDQRERGWAMLIDLWCRRALWFKLIWCWIQYLIDFIILHADANSIWHGAYVLINSYARLFIVTRLVWLCVFSVSFSDTWIKFNEWNIEIHWNWLKLCVLVDVTSLWRE